MGMFVRCYDKDSTPNLTRGKNKQLTILAICLLACIGNKHEWLDLCTNYAWCKGVGESTFKFKRTMLELFKWFVFNHAAKDFDVSFTEQTLSLISGILIEGLCLRPVCKD